MANKSYLDYAGLKRVLKRMLPGARKIWHGTLDEWDALSAAEKDKYDQAEIVINAVNKIELNNKHPVCSNIVKANSNEIGYYYSSTTVQNAANGTWSTDLRVTLTNVAPGNYLVIGYVWFSNVDTTNNHLGIIILSQQSIQSDTTLISTGSAALSIPTSDWYGQSAVLGIMKNNKAQNINIGVSVYKGGNGDAHPAFARLTLLKIA